MLKIGVIGLGSMGKNHARVCSEIENVDLVGVADAVSYTHLTLPTSDLV